MTLAKRLLLGSAAALVATSGAQAADLGLPVAPAVDYVQICSIGSFTGWVLPGSDVCFDISGYARGQLTWTEEIDPYTWSYGTVTLDPDSPTGTIQLGAAFAAVGTPVVGTANNFIGPDVTGVNGITPADAVFDATPTVSAAAPAGVALTGAALATANLNNLAEGLILAQESDVAGITALGYNSALVAAVYENWSAFQAVNAGNVVANVAAFSGGLGITNGATVGGAFGNGEILAGLEALNVTGGNDENTFDGEARLNFDARTMTEYGLLRGFIRLGGENGGAANVDRAFVQMNVGSLGFTAGLADSVFDPVFTGYGSGAAQGLGLADQASNQFSVNAAVGNGVTVSLSVEDDDARTGTILSLTEADSGIAGVAAGATQAAAGVAPSAIGTGGLWTLAASSYDTGASMPDFIAAIRVDQAWGSAKLAAGLHEVNPTGSTVGSEWGYALSASAEFNIPVGVGSTFGITGIYAHGAQQFMGFNNEVGNSSTGFADAMIVTTVTGAAAGVATTATMLDLTTSYTVAAGFNFGLNSMVDLSIDGSYADVDHYGSLFDGNVITVRGGIAYTPVNNLTLNAHVSYATSDFNTSALRTAVDDDEWGARFRVTRSF